jgi:hypothetical protein
LVQAVLLLQIVELTVLLVVHRHFLDLVQLVVVVAQREKAQEMVALVVLVVVDVVLVLEVLEQLVKVILVVIHKAVATFLLVVVAVKERLV